MTPDHVLKDSYCESRAWFLSRLMARDGDNTVVDHVTEPNSHRFLSFPKPYLVTNRMSSSVQIF